MGRSLSLLVILVFVSSIAPGQFKSQGESRTSVNESMVRSDGGGLILGWFDPSKFSMHHSYSLSYSTFGGQSMSLGVYTNSMFYQFSDPLSVQFDVSLMHSPFNSFGDQFSKNLSGIYLSRAELNYRPSENMLFQIQYRQLPAMYWMNMNPYGSPSLLNGIDRYDQGVNH
ncbi:MAG: hypothetical protein WBD36_12870 [Bacteroidota bacterium]